MPPLTNLFQLEPKIRLNEIFLLKMRPLMQKIIWSYQQ